MRQKNIILFLMLLSGIVSAQTTLTVTTGAPNLDGVVSPGEWTSSPLLTLAGVTLNAMADGQFFYMAASWVDASSTETIAKKQWSFDGSSWDQSGDEDRIAFIYDMGLNGDDRASCATMCHGDDLMWTNNGKVDVWHWKAARGNAMGFADDKYFDNILGGDGGRHGDPGTSAYSDNDDDGSGIPSFMATGDPGANVDFLVNNSGGFNAFDPFGVISPHTFAEAVAFNMSATFNTGSVIPGYVLRISDGDRASVQAAGKYDNGMWTVEFKRAMAGGDNDFTVVPGSSVEFTHEIFDNTGSGHPNDGFDPQTYTLDFSQITGIDDRIENKLSSYYLSQNHPNPFNPATIISFTIPQKSFVSLKVYDLLGKEIVALVQEDHSAGSYSVAFNADNIPSGVYFYRLEAGNFLETKKMMLLK